MNVEWLGFLGTSLVVLAYLPQLVHLAREHCTAGLSLIAYATWAVAGALLLAYAVALGDVVFIALQSYHILATSLIVFFLLRYKGQYCEAHGGRHT